jgi:hypothetical protein
VEGRLIVEHLDDETLVYDTTSNEAHALAGAGASEFLAATGEVSRRQILRKLALAGAAVGAASLAKTVSVPAPAWAQSGTPCGNTTCAAGDVCCFGFACRPPGTTCCPSQSTTCGPGTFCCQKAGSDYVCCNDGQHCCGPFECCTCCCIGGLFSGTCESASTCVSGGGQCGSL